MSHTLVNSNRMAIYQRPSRSRTDLDPFSFSNFSPCHWQSGSVLFSPFRWHLHGPVTCILFQTLSLEAGVGVWGVVLYLTLSLPWCHLKTTNKSRNFEILCVFHISMWKDIHQNPHCEIRFVIRPENILFVYVHFSGKNFYMLRQRRG